MSVPLGKRFYLVDREHYRVRSLGGRVTIGRWDDTEGVFYGAGDVRRQRELHGGERRRIDMATVSAVATMAGPRSGKYARWVPWARCFRARFAPAVAATSRSAWVHPYRARALGAA